MSHDGDVLPDLPGLPYPLWIAGSGDGDGYLLPPGCEAAPDRRTWMLLLCLEGAIPLLRQGRLRRLPAGQALLMPYPLAQLAVQPAGGAWQALGFGFVGFDDLVQALIQRGDDFALPVAGWAARQLQALAEGSGEAMDLAAAMRLVCGVLANLLEHNLQERAQDPQSQLVRQAVAILDQAVEQDTSLGQVAEQLGISAAHLSRVFRAKLGQSPSRYLQERRMRRACELLRGGGIEITDIAHRLGYDSASAFAAAFRTSTGMSPTEYRNSRSVPAWDAGA